MVKLENRPDYKVYKHTSPSGKAYIGLTSDLDRRAREQKQSPGCPYFYRAVKKYGWDSFIHEVLKDGLTLEEAKVVEEEMISLHKTQYPYGYNLKSGGQGNNHSDITKRKIGRAHKGKVGSWRGKTLPQEVREKISAGKKGKPSHKRGFNVSDETRKRLSESSLGKPKTEAHKQSMSEERRARSPGVIIAGEHYRSISDAVECLSIPYGTIVARIRSDNFPDYYRNAS